MSEKKETGGSAFPMAGSVNNYSHEGMTLRDYFAGQAIIPIMSWAVDQLQGDTDRVAITANRYAKSAYLIADAMLEARK